MKWLEGEFEGNRNNGLFWAACRAFEADDQDVADELADAALAAGLGEDEVRRTIQSAHRTVAGQQVTERAMFDAFMGRSA